MFRRSFRLDTEQDQVYMEADKTFLQVSPLDIRDKRDKNVQDNQLRSDAGNLIRSIEGYRLRYFVKNFRLLGPSAKRKVNIYL